MLQVRQTQIVLLLSFLFCGAAFSLAFAGKDKAPSKKKSAPAEEVQFTDTFLEQRSDLASIGRNPFFILEPGYTLLYAVQDKKEESSLAITVLNETKTVDGVETRIVEEREIEDGELSEISRNYYAISKVTNNVYYFGEDSKSYKKGKVVNQSGSWESGAKQARYGLMMPGCALAGSRYYQEVAPGEALDRAENVSTSETLQVPAGKFSGCLKTRETTPLEPNTIEYKYYAPGVGLIKDKELVLKRYGLNIK